MSVPLIVTLKFLQHTVPEGVLVSERRNWREKKRQKEREGKTGRKIWIESKREKERERVASSLASVSDCIKLLDSNTKHKGWSRQAVRAAS